MNLDDPSSYGQLDTGGMLEHIAGLPRQCRAAWRLAGQLRLPSAYTDVGHIVIIGMGGSAIGGALLQGLIADECPVPISVVRDYKLPAFARGPDCLAIGCSYSGNTEETLSAMEEALQRQVHPLLITTDGRLAGLARDMNLPIVQFDYRSQPRAALGYSLLLLLGVCWHLGLARDYSSDLEEAAQVMAGWQAEIGPAVPTEHNAAKALALQLAGRLPVIYGADHLAPVAIRWKTQLNENAKYWAFAEAMPELQHNSVVGYDSSQLTREQATVVMLRSSLDHPRVTVRWDVTEEMLVRARVPVVELKARGEGRLAQTLSMIHFGDFLSYYLALLNDVDPTPVDAIAYLKQRLADLGPEG